MLLSIPFSLCSSSKGRVLSPCFSPLFVIHLATPMIKRRIEIVCSLRERVFTADIFTRTDQNGSVKVARPDREEREKQCARVCVRIVRERRGEEEKEKKRGLFSFFSVLSSLRHFIFFVQSIATRVPCRQQ